MTKKKRARKRSRVDALAPPREGLIPGTWKMMDPSRMGGIIDRPRSPSRWTPHHVGMRLIEAHRTLKRLPMNIRPASVKTAWPVFASDPVDAASDDENPRVDATSEQISMMEEAIGWPMRFLPEWGAGDLNRWASQTTVEEFELLDPGHHSVPWHELRTVANGLNQAKEIVR